MSYHELHATIEGDYESLHVRYRFVCNATDDPDRQCAMPARANDCPEIQPVEEGGEVDPYACGYGYVWEGGHYHDNADPAGAECIFQAWFDNESVDIHGEFELVVPVRPHFAGEDYPEATIIHPAKES